MALFLNANCFDLLLSVALGLGGSRTNLNPGGVCGPGFNDFALLGRLLLNDVVVRAPVDINGGPYAYYEGGPYAYGGGCYIQRQAFINRFGHRVIRCVRVCD
jgi:hypothetical protein